MSDDNHPLNLEAAPTSESVRTYYQHQYERMAQLENQRQTFTTIILTLSILAFTFGFKSNNSGTITDYFAVIQNIILLIVIAIANVMAVSFMRRTQSWVSSHRSRAKATLKKFDIALYNLDKESLDESWASYKKQEGALYQFLYRLFGGRGRTQEKLHWIILFGSLALLIIQCIELF